MQADEEGQQRQQDRRFKDRRFSVKRERQAGASFMPVQTQQESTIPMTTCTHMQIKMLQASVGGWLANWTHHIMTMSLNEDGHRFSIVHRQCK